MTSPPPAPTAALAQDKGQVVTIWDGSAGRAEMREGTRMVAMPYILVNIVADLLSLILFCVSSAAVLSKYQLFSRFLPAQLKNHKTLVFVAQVLALVALAIVVVRVIPRGNDASRTARLIFELFFYIGFANSVVLTFQFLNRRYLLDTPKVQRWLLIALGAIVVPSVGVIAVASAVTLLFTIR